MLFMQDYQWRGIIFALERDESTWLVRVILGGVMLLLKVGCSVS